MRLGEMKSEDICSVGSKGETNEQLVNAEPEIPRREPRKACITQIQEIQVTLADINGVHPAITELEKELFLPPLGFSLGLSLKSEQKMEIVQSALRAMPARLTKSHGKYRCIGNVRLYRLAVSCLAPSEEISALVTTSRDKRDVIQPNYLAEIYLLPAVLALGLDDVRRLYEIWKNNKDNQLFKSVLPLRTKTAFADAFRVSPASLTKKS